MENKKKLSKEELKEKTLEYLDIIDEYNDMIDSFKMWENISEDGFYDDLKKSFESTNDEYKDMSEDEIRDAKWEKRKEREQQIKKSVSESISKLNSMMTIMMDNVAKITEFISKLTNIQNYIIEIQEIIINYINELKNELWFQHLKRQVDLLILKIKRIMIRFKKYLSNLKIKILELFINGKCCAAMEAAYGAIISTIVTVATALMKVVDFINKIMDYIPKNFSIEPEGLSFFMTPKYPSGSITMPISNMNQSVGDFLSEVLKESIHELLDSPKLANIAEKQAYVANKMAESIEQLNGKVPELTLPNVSIPDPEILIYKAIDTIISLVPSAQPMPKFEKLNPTNIGFMIWLSTGWCRAGQVAFGMPGQLIGLPSN